MREGWAEVPALAVSTLVVVLLVPDRFHLSRDGARDDARLFVLTETVVLRS